MAKQQKIVVTLNALTARINRVLEKEGKQLKKDRAGGGWYILKSSGSVGYTKDLEAFGRECGALKSFEALEAPK